MEASVIGGSGYVGAELLRLILGHGGLRLKQVTALTSAGKEVALVHPHLRGRSDLKFCRLEDLEPCDVLFVCLPNGASMGIMPGLRGLAPLIIDLGADFRLKEPGLWKAWYRTEHASPELLPEFRTGIPEIHGGELRSAKLAACPGCEAIVSILALYPLLKGGLVESGRVIVDAKMSSSQAGRSPSLSGHHPERRGVVRTYKATGHRHQAEIEQALKGFKSDLAVQVTATAVEMVRGLLVTIHTYLTPGITEKEVWRAYRESYREAPFVRIIKQSQGLYRFPEPKLLSGTNYCDIGFELDARSGRLVVVAAIDNLTKGSGGNALQVLNLMAGFDEGRGLEFGGLYPI